MAGALSAATSSTALISRKEAAAFLKRAPGTLANWHTLRRGPPVRMVLGRAYYDFEELRAFAGQERVTSTPEGQEHAA